VLGTDRERFLSALGSKVQGALHLDELTRGRELDLFVLFSSATALLGTPGQSNYAAANAFLDALAHARRAAGLPATSINWGPWSTVGLAAARADRGERLSRQGLASLSPRQGVSAFARLLGEAAPQVAVMRLDVARWSELHPAAASSAFFEELRRDVETSASVDAVTKASGGVRDEILAATLEGERRALIEKYVQEQVAHVLRLASSRVATDRPLKAMGMDSLMTLELRNRLEVDLGLTLPASVVWNYPTVTLLAGHLATLLTPAPAAAGAEAGDSHPARAEQRLAPTASSTAPSPEELDELSAAEVERLLADELASVDDLLKES
jgi:acyl carrier protein